MERMSETNNNNNNYQLFPEPDTMRIDTVIYNIQNNNEAISSYGMNDLTPGYFKITKEELENINNKKVINILSKHIQNKLNKNPNKLYNLTKYTLFVIDEIQAEIFISIEEDTSKYYYKIVSKNIYYNVDVDDYETEDDDDGKKDLVIYDNYGFENLVSLLEDIKYVEKHYKLLDYYLLSPDNMEEALAQRKFIPISQDNICIVCYEPTIEYTTCKHSICLKCREKCIRQGNKMCPM
jgi:hypothetical protein